MKSNTKNKVFFKGKFFFKKEKEKENFHRVAEQVKLNNIKIHLDNIKSYSSGKNVNSNSDLRLLVDCTHLTESTEITHVIEAAFTGYVECRSQGGSKWVCMLHSTQPQRGTLINSCFK